jgi:hypothetical protein
MTHPKMVCALGAFAAVLGGGCGGEVKQAPQGDNSVVVPAEGTVQAAPPDPVPPPVPGWDGPIVSYPCPFFTDITAEPTVAPIGGVIRLSARSSSDDGTILWAELASNGRVDASISSYADAGAMVYALYTCRDIGAHTFSVTLTLRGTACSDVEVVSISCAPDPRAR